VIISWTSPTSSWLMSVCPPWLKLSFQFFQFFFNIILFLLHLQRNLVCDFSRGLAVRIITYNTFGVSGLTVPCESTSEPAFLTTTSVHSPWRSFSRFSSSCKHVCCVWRVKRELNWCLLVFVCIYWRQFFYFCDKR
jgi:hypothetical protein